MDRRRACTFCRIVAGELRSSLVHRDELVWAFMDLHPVRRGHTLVIPARHAVLLDELDPGTRAWIWNVGHRVAQAIRSSSIPSDAVNLLLNDGRAANQTVPHVHLHVLPRSGRDLLRVLLRLGKTAAGLGLSSPESAARRAALDADAAEIRDRLLR